MDIHNTGKIVSLNDLILKIKDLRIKKNIIVQSHGIFDLVHPGIISHLTSAKKQGDILITTVIKDKDVRRGPGRPIFPEQLRAQNVASLEMVDLVCIVDDGEPFECVKLIKPDFFAKGRPYQERDRHIHDKIFNEERELFFGKIKIIETEGFRFSSSGFINSFLELYPPETRLFLKEFSKKYSFNDIVDKIDSLADLKIILIGDGIIDEYHYCESMGKSAKAHLVVNKYLLHEVFAGGAFAIANHIAGICKEVQLVTLLGKDDTREQFISDNLKPNIKTKFFYRNDGPTIIKKRYINQYLNQKLFEINYLNNSYIDTECQQDIINFLIADIPKYDVVLVSDFGHGFITNDIIKIIENKSKKFAVNTQTNSANTGFNMITKYHKPYFICLDEPEIRWAAQERYKDVEEIAKSIMDILKSKYLIVTLGKKGSIGITFNNDVNRTPIFSTKVVDTVGAGDAFFAYTAPCIARDMPLDFVCFIGNAVGALAVQIMGNKKSVEKHELLEFIYSILK